MTVRLKTKEHEEIVSEVSVARLMEGQSCFPVTSTRTYVHCIGSNLPHFGGGHASLTLALPHGLNCGPNE